MGYRNALTFERASELLEADPDRGLLRWRKPESRAGRRAGSAPTEPSDYCIVAVDGTLYKVHRVMWLLCTGKWPENIVDHINGDRHDNRMANLRDVPHAVNQRNQAYHRAGVTKGEWDRAIRERAAARQSAALPPIAPARPANVARPAVRQWPRVAAPARPWP